MSDDFNKKQNEKMFAASIAAEAKSGAISAFESPGKQWDRIIETTVFYTDDDLTAIVLKDIDEFEQCGITPAMAIPYVRLLKKYLFVGINYRSLHNPPQITAASLLTQSKKRFGLPVWDLSPSFFVNRMGPGQTVVVRGARGSGKTDFTLHYLAMPWMLQKHNHVISGINIDNDKDWTGRYHYHSSLSTQLLKACEIIIETCKDVMVSAKEDNPNLNSDDLRKLWRIAFPSIMRIQDEASISKGRMRTTSDKVVQQLYLATIARHFGLNEVEIHPADQVTFFTKDFMTHDIRKLDKGRVRFQADIDKTPLILDVWGLKGLPDFEPQDNFPEVKRPYLGFNTHKPESFVVDLDLVSVLDVVNRIQEQKKGNLLKQFEATRDSIIEVIESRNGGIITLHDLYLSAAVIWLFNEKKNGYRTPVRITQPMISSLMKEHGVKFTERTFSRYVKFIKNVWEETPEEIGTKTKLSMALLKDRFSEQFGEAKEDDNRLPGIDNE